MSLYTYWRTRGRMGLSAAIAFLLAMGMAAWFGVPAAGTRSGALLIVGAGAGSPAISILWLVVFSVVAAIAGLLVGGRIRPDAGVFSIGALFAAVSWHAGRVSDVFFVAPNARTYLSLAAETVALGAIVGAALCITQLLVKRGTLVSDEGRDGLESDSASAGESTLAVLATAVAYGLACCLLLPVDDKQQAMFGTLLAGFVAAAAVHQFLVSSARSWAVVTGVLLGAVGSYLYAYSTPGTPAIGYVAIPPARALPLDHAAAAAAAAVTGYWYSRRWKRGEG